VPAWSAKPLREVPLVAEEESGDPDWYPLQYHLGLTAFGANAYAASAAGDQLLERHTETDSKQEELYVVVVGSALFVLDGEEVRAEAPFVVAVGDPSVAREERALEAGTLLIALGERRELFESSWPRHYFEGVPRA